MTKSIINVILEVHNKKIEPERNEVKIDNTTVEKRKIKPQK